MNEPKRILYHFRVRGVGVERVHIAGIAGAFRDLGYEVDFVSPTGANPLLPEEKSPEKTGRSLLGKIADRVPHTVFALMELFYNLYSYRKLENKLKTGRYAALYERYAFFGFSAALLCRKYNVKLLYEVNELSGYERVREQRLVWLARWCESFSFKRADLVVCVSKFLKDAVLERAGKDTVATVVPNAVSTDFMEEDEEFRAKTAQTVSELGLEGKKIIGYLGSIVPWHRFDVLLNAFSKILKENPDAHLLMVGDGWHRPEFEKLAASLGLSPNVSMTGNVPHAQVRRYVAAFDIAVVPNSNEYRSPVKMFEYMALGKCVVVPDCPPILDIIRNGENGLIFRNGNAESLAAALSTALASEPARQEIGENARREVAQKYTWLHHGRAILGLVGLPCDEKGGK